MVDGYPNYHYLTASVDGVRTQLESGINAVREVDAIDGIRRPVIALRSSPWKAGTETTPWHDAFDLERGRIRYFGDHKVTSPGPVGSTVGNAALAKAWALHRGGSREDRLLAPPLMIFRAVSANGAMKGYVQFCGLALIERLEQVVQRDPLTGLRFPNYVSDLLVIDTSQEGEEVDWRWIDDRRDPSLSLDQTLRFAPSGWQQWISEGASALPAIRRHGSIYGQVPDSGASPQPDRQPHKSVIFDDGLLQLINRVIRVGQVITTLSKGRPNRIVAVDPEGLRVETEKSAREGTGPQLVPAWMIIAGWRHLVEHGRLSQMELLEDLNVKRSAFVCALLAHFPGVEVEEDPNVVLRLKKSAMRGISEAETIGAWPSTGRPDSLRRDDESWRGGAIYAARLNSLFETVRAADGRPYTSEEVAEALQADGIPVHSDSIARLRAGAVDPPSDTLSYALAFFFDVDTNYFTSYCDDETNASGRPPVTLGVGDVGPAVDPDTTDDPAGDCVLSAAQFVRVLAGLAQALKHCYDDPVVDQQILNRLALTLSDASALLLESLSGEVIVPRGLAERLIASWAETNPRDSGTESEYLWAATTFRRPGI
jgi:hypothetical protein